MSFFLWKGVAPDTEICGQQAQPSLEAFEAAGARGAVIVCPGGGYACKADYEGAPIAEMIRQAGISAFVLDYRVKPFRMETPLNDVKRAIRILRFRGYQKVGVLGFSAGGHLAGAAATLYDLGDPTSDEPIERFSSRPDAFVSCYGATSFRVFEQTWAHETLGEEYSPEMIARFSAELNVTPNTPPAFIWHTADDPVVPVRSAILLASALSANGVACELHIYPHGPHGLALASADPVVGQWCGQVQRWLLRLGFGAAESSPIRSEKMEN